MKYEVTHEGPLEIHKVSIHQVDLVAAGHRLDKPLYTKLRRSGTMAEQCLALALIVRAVEDFKAGEKNGKIITAHE